LHKGKIEQHYIPDFDSDWTKWAVRNYVRIIERFGPIRYTLDQIKRAKGIERRDRCDNYRLKMYSEEDLRTKKHIMASYGEMLAVLCYGIDSTRTPSGGKRSRSEDCRSVVYEQKPLVCAMTADEHMLRSSLYVFLSRIAQRSNAPSFS